jgi:hypothetical protein
LTTRISPSANPYFLDKMDGPADKTAKPAPPSSWQKYRTIISQRYHEELDHHIFYRSHQRILRGMATPYELGIAGVYIWFCAQFPARAPIYGIGLAAVCSHHDLV